MALNGDIKIPLLNWYCFLPFVCPHKCPLARFLGDDGWIIFVSSQRDDLSAPLEVLVEQTTSSSVQLSWKPPPSPKGRNLKLFTYSLTLTPLTHYGGHGLEKEFSLPPSITSKLVGGLTEGTRYVVQLSAIYGDPTRRLSHDALVRVAAPKFTVFTPPEAQQDIPVGDDGLPPDEPPCNCSDTGMVACTRRPGFVECTCQPGYGGTWCEECAPGNFRAGKECVLCPCSNLTSTAECKMESSGQVSCVQCLPGHRGSLCTSCSAGYQWTEDKCVPLNCLSSSLCAQQRNAPGCEDCIFLENKFPTTAHRSKSDRSIADGTLPLIAVIVTLGVLLLVAAMATCYRYWDYRRHQPRIPFWSIELQDEKTDLHSHCQYQHLDAATNKTVSAAATSSQPQTNGEVGRLNSDSIRRTYNTINV
ncbi:Multiple epidermal growth factor-like domain protein [Argiope bruennichi]|uniref:Multiple epidermal growth factor-like domain protein n=1 Tax=Argiope bruennichi TaxID=94029 RepID=A0A8T0EB58_ARGBR|nr:Multiple epidermal growth factor-like domain protein [Argiope bruennichi]